MPKGKVKSEAGKLLSKYITEIASEKIEIDLTDGSVTKAEALARVIWRAALGFNEKIKLKDGIEKTKIHAPSLSHQNIIIDRMEGKAAQAEKPVKPAKKDDATSKISTELAKRINDVNKNA